VLVEQAFRAHAAKSGSADNVREGAVFFGRRSLERGLHRFWIADNDSLIAALTRSISIFRNHFWLVDARAAQGD
jgi:hypothetical protein